MASLSRFLLIPWLLMLALSATVAMAADEDDEWAPTPPRLSFIDGQVSYWRQGADEWADARRNLALAEGDALYAGKGANFEVQFDSRSFVRGDEGSLLALENQEEHFLQFKVNSGLVSFDIRSLAVGDSVEVDTPDATFLIEHPGYYRVEVGSRTTHFITRRGGRATVTTADGHSLSIYPSEDIVITSGDPVQVATYAAPAPDAWDRWNDARTERIGESVSSRYLPPDVYGVEELDHYGRWRVVPDYGPVWIPFRVAPGWVPYSTGSWIWDPYYEWTWMDDAPWGWAPFHYGRWVYVGNYWAWCPGPVVRRSVYYPALVVFIIRDHDVSVRISTGLPGLWWVALSWGEPVLPWWRHHRHRWHPRWDGWGGPRIVNNVVINRTTIINVGDIRYRNASVPRAILTVPKDKFGRERFRATEETRYRGDEFVPVRDDFPVKPSRESLIGGAPKGAKPPRDIVVRPVVSTRPPRERVLPWEEKAPRERPEAVPKTRYVKPPPRREMGEEAETGLPRPPFGTQAGPERKPEPPPPRLKEIKLPPPVRTPSTVRTQEPVRKEASIETRTAPSSVVVPPPPTARQSPPPPSVREERVQIPREERVQMPQSVRTAPRRVEPEERVLPLPGQPANQTYKGQSPVKRSWSTEPRR